MKTYFTAFIILLASFQVNAQRYLTEVFNDVTVQSDILYSINISILTGTPEPDTLYADYYMPMGDTITDRPLVIVAHTGSFLPVGPPGFLNGQTTGSKLDYSVTEICTRLAKRGYVAAAIDYRLGWNPLADEAAERRNQLINAAYRGLQDGRAFVRFNNMMVEDNGNPFGICPDNIAVFGVGTGGYLALVMAALDQQEEIYIPKFQDPLTGDSFIDTTFVGDIYGEKEGLINIPNHVGYSSDIHFGFNAGGALGDVSWLDENTPPLAAAHVVSDPFAPFWINPATGESDCEGPVTVPVTGEFVVDVAGSKCVIEANNDLNNNDIFNIPLVMDDPINMELMNRGYSAPNLWAIHLPGPQAGPWDYWDEAFWDMIPHPSGGTFHTQGLVTNPDMSLDKANRYIDTLIEFFSPRAYVALQACTDNVEEIINVNTIGFSMAPNPAGSFVNFQAENSQILDLQLFDINGRLVKSVNSISSNTYQLNRNQIPPGLYIAKVRFEEGIIAEKILFE